MYVVQQFFTLPCLPLLHSDFGGATRTWNICYYLYINVACVVHQYLSSFFYYQFRCFVQHWRCFTSTRGQRSYKLCPLPSFEGYVSRWLSLYSCNVHKLVTAYCSTGSAVTNNWKYFILSTSSIQFFQNFIFNCNYTTISEYTFDDVVLKSTVPVTNSFAPSEEFVP
jgi:hypothetical protein